MWRAHHLVVPVVLLLASIYGCRGGALRFPHQSKGRGIAEESADLEQLSTHKQLSRRLDIVLTHFHSDRLEPMLKFWLDFLDQDKVKELEPTVFIYCQNEQLTNMSSFEPLLKHAGEVVHLENVGREAHAFLQHITSHYDNLSDHTLFSQDLPEGILKDRFLNMHEPKTGFLPLAIVGHADCFDDFLPIGALPQLYSMFVSRLCPPEGYTAAFEGQFVVSKERIHRQGWWTYRNLMEFVSAPEDHWIHAMHNNKYYKDKTNPLFGHALERAWSLAFDCFEVSREANCLECDNEKHMKDCGEDACQCYDQ